jgi:Beta-propeller repeat/S-layer homology domain
MTSRKAIFRMCSMLILILFLLAGVLPAQAETSQMLLSAIGDFGWAKSMGGSQTESAPSIVLDANGNIYTTGGFKGTADFDPGVGTSDLISAGDQDIFVSKLDSNGDFIWAKRLGGISVEESKSIDVDSNGNVYITGTFQGTADFDPGAGSYDLTSFGRYDIFVAKLDSNGNFVWAKSIVGTYLFADDSGSGIVVDSNGNVYVTGTFQNTADFDPGAGTYNLTAAGNSDVFVLKLDDSGNFIWAKNMGGTGFAGGISIDVDPNGNIYTTGDFDGPADFDPGAGTFNLMGTDVYSFFVSKLDGNGNFVWAKATGGMSLQVDPNGNVYIGGAFGDTVDFDPSAETFNMSSEGIGDAFLSKLDSNGNFIWAKRMGGAGFDFAKSIVLDTSNSVYATGWFVGTADFDPGAGTFNLTALSAEDDIFVSKLDSNGHFHWAKRMGGTVTDWGYGIALDAMGNVYTTGTFSFTADFDPNASVFNLTSAGDRDVFISKLQNSPVGGDITPPNVVSITRANANPANSSSVSFDVTFSEPVIDVNIDDFTLNVTGITGATIGNVTGSGSNYIVTVNTGSGNGSLGLNVPLTAMLSDLAGNPIGGLPFTSGAMYTILKTATFSDVGEQYWARNFVERLYAAGITGGCALSPLQYCPEGTVTRAQMAVFLERGIHGSSYNPPGVGSSTGFGDVPVDYWSGAWIKQLATEGITGGCGSGDYCPGSPVTRAQMAVFLLRSKYGASYAPPAVGSSTGFGDVQVDYWAGAWIKQLVAEGITAGCGTGTYCPETPVTRAQMAVFLVKTFNLP